MLPVSFSSLSLFIPFSFLFPDCGKLGSPLLCTYISPSSAWLPLSDGKLTAVYSCGSQMHQVSYFAGAGGIADMILAINGE